MVDFDFAQDLESSLSGESPVLVGSDHQPHPPPSVESVALMIHHQINSFAHLIIIFAARGCCLTITTITAPCKEDL